MDAMTSPTMTELETQLNTLDQETAQRVTRLVFECSASLDLALLAVHDANRNGREESRQLRPRHKIANILATLWAR
jgi:hypothetical protein